MCNLTIACLAILIIALAYLLYTHKSPAERFGGFITPTEVMGAVRQGSTTMSGAVEEQTPREECIKRCLGALQGADYLDSTYADERAQMCFGMC